MPDGEAIAALGLLLRTGRVEAAIEAAGDERIAAFIRENRAACEMALALARRDAAAHSIDGIRAHFDAAAALCPGSAVALYSFGRAELLDAASREIVATLDAWGALRHGGAALEIGCGIGRLIPALAGRMGRVTGLDLSPAMIAAAQARCGALANVTLQVTDGRDLVPLPDRSFSLVLAVDVFPYLVRAGDDLAARHVAEAARVLAPAGDLVVLNYSYRGDDGRDRAELAALAAANGLAVLREGERPFRSWDGLAFHLRRLDAAMRPR